MPLVRISYVTVVLLAGIGSITASAFSQETGYLILVGFQLAIAVLTYPLGVVGSLLSAGLILSGMLTPLEALLLATPVFAILGQLQWFWLLPKIYRGN